MNNIDFVEQIQKAILPSNKEMKEALVEYFIFHKPLERLSGDIYWFTQRGKKIFIAVVDCTGHGIGGALLSIFGNWTLDKLVKERHLSDPALVLHELHSEVCRALKYGEGAKYLDGMDVALCVIEKGKNKITFAGARRPLFLVRFTPSPEDSQKREAKLLVIKGDKKSIGGIQREKERVFSCKEIDVSPGDIMYLTTDGFTNQNNGEDQKYGLKRLITFLPMTARLPVAVQEQYFEKELQDFMGEEEQRDDITVIGVRV